MGINELQSVGQLYEEYLGPIRSNWEYLIDGIVPKTTQCGPVYELDNPLGRDTESFAIADMRGIEVALPHAHTNGESEIYLVMQGSGITVVGEWRLELSIGKMAVTQPETAHFTIPKENLVLAVINTPSFQAENVVDLDPEQSYAQYHFNSKQFSQLAE